MISHCVCDFTSLFISPLLPLMDVLVVSGFIAVIFLVQVPCYASDSLGNISRSRVDRLCRVCDLKEIMPNCSLKYAHRSLPTSNMSETCGLTVSPNIRQCHVFLIMFLTWSKLMVLNLQCLKIFWEFVKNADS